MFFGTVLTPGVEYTPDCNNGEILHLSQACLYNPTSNDRTYIHVTDGDKSYALCALQKDKQENASLDLFVSTRAGTSFKISGGKNEVHLIGYFEPEADTDSDEEFSEWSHEDEDTDEDVSSMEGEDAKDSSDENDEQSTEENGEGSSSDDDDDDQEDEDELMDSGDDIDDDDDLDDDEDEEEEKEIEKKKVLPATTKKIDDKVGKKSAKIEKPVPATTESKKRKVETPVQKPQKIQKTESSNNNSAEAEFEKAVADYLKKNGRCMIAQLAGKVRKPDALKAVKYQAFLKSKPSSFVIEGQYVSLKA